MAAKRSVRAALVCGVVAVMLAGCGSGSAITPNSSSAVASSALTVHSLTPATSSPAGASSGSPAPTSPRTSTSVSTSGGSAPDPAAAARCAQQDGQVRTRSAFWGTNGNQAGWLPLAGSTAMCRFQADDEAKSRIYVDLTTLYSAEPTLAGLAYLSRVPMPTPKGGGNPATAYCTNLGGSSTFGSVSAVGGGWVAKGDPDDVVVALCVFPDLSFIDEWGLAYHSTGDIRGKDLMTAMKYRPGGALAPVFTTS